MQELSTRSTQERRWCLRRPLSPTRRGCFSYLLPSTRRGCFSRLSPPTRRWLPIQPRYAHRCRNLEVRGIPEAQPLEVATAAI
jgi:hypothetical protein